jgi:hypothetical protein
MKRAFAMLLALAAMLTPALAEEKPALEGQLAEGETVQIDLDGDGEAESVRWAVETTEQGVDCLTVTVQPGAGEALVYATDIVWKPEAFALDLDGDGAVELLLSGDVMSDDYYTACLRYDGSTLYEVLFPDSNRGNSGSGYFKQGYGRITAIENGRLTLSGSQDVLGTWFATRQVRLSPYDRFEFDDDGLWVRDPMVMDDADLWKYAALTAKIELTYTAPDGSEATLPAGEKLLIVASDKKDIAHFTTPDGLIGALDISPDYDHVWGWKVNGVSESDCFENLLYAD